MKNKVPIKTLRSRPRFKVYTKMSKEEFIALIQKHLEIHKSQMGGYANKEVAMIRLRTKNRTYWQPQVQIRMEKDEDNPKFLVVRGVIGPRANVWTLFMFLYGLSGAVFITMGSYVVSEYLVKGESHWLWSLFFAAGIALATFVASKIGQYISKSHLNKLYSFIDELLIDAKFYEKRKDLK